VVGHGFES